MMSNRGEREPQRIFQFQLFSDLVLDVRTNAEIALPDSRIIQSNRDRYIQEVQTNITSPEAAMQYFRDNIFTPFDHCVQEELWVLILNTKNVVTHQAMIYRGTNTTMNVRVAEIFRVAIQTNATAIIVGHNHPSGDPEVSPEDVQTTHSLVEAGQLLGIEVLDHIVVGVEVCQSLKQMGLGFS